MVKKQIGIFICHCGTNIAGTVDVERVAKTISHYPGIAFSTHYKYMCSEPGQEIIRKAIKEHQLDAVVVAACSPTLHEITFRNVLEDMGMNPYQCEIANIREQCSWVHEDKEKATMKAIQIIQTIIEKVRLNESLKQISVPVTKRALVIGGGIAGIQASLDIAHAGYEVILLERNSSIGGRMAQLSETFPTLDCSQCILTPKMVEAGHHKKIKLYTYCELEELSGIVGNFKAKIKRKAGYVDWDKCTGCGLCSEKCPSRVPSEFNEKLGERKAIYIPFAQAVPNKAVIDRDNCIYFQKGRCRVCEKICPSEAVDFEQKESVEEIEIGAVVVATGYDPYPKEDLKAYGAGGIKDLITGLEFERMLSASGPTNGKVLRPSDNKEPKEVVFVQCAGSRDPENGVSFCSKICCMYTTKHAMLYRHKVHDGRAYVFYIDIRSPGKGYEEFVHSAQEKEKVIYIRGKVGRIFEKDGKINVWGVDTLAGNHIEIQADMVVVATPMMPSKGAIELSRKMKVSADSYGFFSEAHPKLRPLESLTAGVFLAGACQGPKDIPETVSQASGAAGKVIVLFSHKTQLHDPIIAVVDKEVCTGCNICIMACPYDARKLDEKKKIAIVDDILCKGCGACVSACPSGATKQKNFTSEQIYRMVESIFI